MKGAQVVLALTLAGCSTPAPVLDTAPTAMLVRSTITITELGPVRRCTYTVLGTDRLVRTADFCPPVLEVTPAQVQQAREQIEAPLP